MQCIENKGSEGIQKYVLDYKNSLKILYTRSKVQLVCRVVFYILSKSFFCLFEVDRADAFDLPELTELGGDGNSLTCNPSWTYTI